MAGAVVGTGLLGTFAQADDTELGSMALIPGSPWSLIVLVLALQGVNGLFAAAETSVALLRPMHVRHLREKGGKEGLRLQDLLDKQSICASASQVGSRIIHGAIILVAIILAGAIAPNIAGWYGWDADNLLVILGIGAVLILFPILPLTLTIEHGFRAYSVVHPHGVALRLYSLIRATAFLLAWPAHLFSGFSRLISARLSKAELAVANQTEQEIKTLVESGEESGEIEAEEKKLLHSVFDFTDTVAREVMTPRVDLDALPITGDTSDVMRLVHESGHSRIPIYEGTDDQIVGIIHAKDLMLSTLNGRSPSLRSLIRPAYFVPENKNLHELMSEMRHNRTQMAIVQDEFGGTAGVVTIEDIVEELVGDILDEYDVEDPEIVPLDDGWSVDGRMHLDDLNQAVGSEFDNEEFDTIGGLVFGAFGRQPKIRESIDLDGYRFSVLHTDGRPVNRLLVQKLQEEPASTADRETV